jgi:endonuclease YncB( thermonuclease family)
MPAARTNHWGRSILLRGCALGACGWIMLGSAHAQSADPGKPVPPAPPAAAANQAGGLDMDANPTTPPAAASQNQPGGLDMDVNPTAPAPAPGRVVAGKPGNVQDMSRDNVQDGVHIANVNPGPVEGPPSASQPGVPPVSTNVTPVSVTPTSAPPTSVAPTSVAPAPPTITTSIATPGPPPPTAVVTQPPPTTNTTVTTPAVATPAAPAPQPEPVKLDHPTVVDTADLRAGDTIVSLYGIDGVQGEAVQGLQGFLGSTDSHLTCQAQPGAGYVCLLPDGTDVAEVALVNGAARAKDDAPDAYRDQEAAAQAARRGIWANLPPPPATLKHPAVQDTATLVSDGQTYVLNGILGLGAPYAGQLQGYIQANGDSLTCQPQIEPGEYICMMKDGTDIAKVALVNGAARVGPDAPDSYRVQQLDALNNRRGFWVNPPPDVLLAVSTVQAIPVCCVYDPGDDGVDGITYVGGVPEAMIDGEPEFLYYGGDAGWGYYDHDHHWRGAPDRFRQHLDRFHADGHGLRGYGHDAEVRRDAATHREEAVRGGAGMQHEAMQREAALHAGVARPGGVGERPGMGGVQRSAMGGAMHPAMGGAAGHPGFGGAAMGHPGMGGGFMRPAPSMGGFHPGGMSMGHAAAPAMHASAGGGGGRRK